MKLAEIRNVAAAGNFGEALTQVEALLTSLEECPCLWNYRGVLILLDESDNPPPLEEAAKSFSRALELDPKNLEALEELAHYYDAIDSQPDMARKYASEYVENVKPVIDAMERILAEER